MRLTAYIFSKIVERSLLFVDKLAESLKQPNTDKSFRFNLPKLKPNNKKSKMDTEA